MSPLTVYLCCLPTPIGSDCISNSFSAAVRTVYAPALSASQPSQCLAKTALGQEDAHTNDRVSFLVDWFSYLFTSVTRRSTCALGLSCQHPDHQNPCSDPHLQYAPAAHAHSCRLSQNPKVKLAGCMCMLTLVDANSPGLCLQRVTRIPPAHKCSSVY